MKQEALRISAEVASATVPLAEVVVTDRLRRPPERPPEYAAEAEALRELARQMAADPQTVLRNLTQAALELCRAGSAGVSLLERGPGGEEFFRIAAAAGAAEAYAGQSYARQGSLCGHCLSQGGPQLYARPARHFRGLERFPPLRGEELALPFDVEGKAVGTLWIATHDDARRFDAEDVRLMGALADFSAAALRVARAATELRDGDDRLRLALEAGNLGTFEWNLDSGRVEWSENQERIHGLEPGTFDGTFESFASLIHPDDLPAARERIERALRTGEPYETEFRIRKADGSIGWVVGRGAPRYDASGRPIGIVGVCSDITDSILAEKALRRGERTSRFLADASAALAALDGSERTLAKLAKLAVPRFADWCAVDLVDGDSLRRVEVAHVDPSKVELAREIHRRYPPDPNDPRGTWQIARTGQPVLIPEIDDELLVASIDDPVKLKVVREIGLKSYIGVPLMARDRALGVLTFATSDSGRMFDETDLAIAEDLARRTAVAIENVRLYEEVADAARRKDEFLAMLGHELRNPLAPIRSGLELLELSGAEHDVVELMSGQVDHLVRLVDDLLDVSRIIRGRVQLKRTTVDLADLIRRAVETVRSLTAKANQDLRISLPSPSPKLDADPVRLTQVFSNLLHNASKYGSVGGRISVEATLEGENVVVRVSDDGTGIDADLLPRVFDLFAQSTRTIDRAQGGLGLGLTIVKNLVEMHGGRVSAHSEGRGHGSEFVVRLPALIAAKPVAIAIEPAPASNCRRILVVDDNVPAAKLLVRLLEKLGRYDIVAAHDGESALVAAQAYRPDLILLDIGLPRMDGHETVRRLRRDPATKDSLIVALTGYGAPENRKNALDAGFDDHYVKPPGVDMLRRILSHPKLAEE